MKHKYEFTVISMHNEGHTNTSGVMVEAESLDEAEKLARQEVWDDPETYKILDVELDWSDSDET